MGWHITTKTWNLLVEVAVHLWDMRWWKEGYVGGTESSHSRCEWVWLITSQWTEEARRCMICVHVFILWIHTQLSSARYGYPFILRFLWMKSFLSKHEICIMFKCFLIHQSYWNKSVFSKRVKAEMTVTFTTIKYIYIYIWIC